MFRIQAMRKIESLDEVVSDRGFVAYCDLLIDNGWTIVHTVRIGATPELLEKAVS